MDIIYMAEQPLNASYPIVVIEFGIIIEERVLHSLNAPKPILVTEEGMGIDRSSRQS